MIGDLFTTNFVTGNDFGQRARQGYDWSELFQFFGQVDPALLCQARSFLDNCGWNQPRLNKTIKHVIAAGVLLQIEINELQREALSSTGKILVAISEFSVGAVFAMYFRAAQWWVKNANDSHFRVGYQVVFFMLIQGVHRPGRNRNNTILIDQFNLTGTFDTIDRFNMVLVVNQGFGPGENGRVVQRESHPVRF